MLLSSSSVLNLIWTTPLRVTYGIEILFLGCPSKGSEPVNPKENLSIVVLERLLPRRYSSATLPARRPLYSLVLFPNDVFVEFDGGSVITAFYPPYQVDRVTFNVTTETDVAPKFDRN